MDSKDIKIINGIPHKKTPVACPDEEEGCSVSHYKWVELESENKRKDLFEETTRVSRNVRALGYIVQNYTPQLSKEEINEWRSLLVQCVNDLNQLEIDVVSYVGKEEGKESKEKLFKMRDEKEMIESELNYIESLREKDLVAFQKLDSRVLKMALEEKKKELSSAIFNHENINDVLELFEFKKE